MEKKRASHEEPTSRLGGVAIFLSVVTICFSKSDLNFIALLAVCLPCFLFGLLEDLGFRTPPIARLVLTLVSASGVLVTQDLWLYNLNLGFDINFEMAPAVGFIVTALALALYVHSINLMDGLNGLAAGQVIISLACLIYFVPLGSETDVLFDILLLLCAVCGFFVWNFPNGRIFLGDFGSYLLGFLAGFFLIELASSSDSSQLSGWGIYLIFFWPFTEALFSIYRRQITRRAIFRADMLHYHHVIMRVIEIKSSRRVRRRFANPIAALTVILLSCVPAVTACLLADKVELLLISTVAFISIFIFSYWALIRSVNAK